MIDDVCLESPCPSCLLSDDLLQADGRLVHPAVAGGARVEEARHDAADPGTGGGGRLHLLRRLLRVGLEAYLMPLHARSHGRHDFAVAGRVGLARTAVDDEDVVVDVGGWCAGVAEGWG